MAAQEQERPGMTEMHVRMDCNGCVQRIKKALHGVEGVYEVRVDFPQQKLTVVGRASPDKIVKAIKKTRKIATVCSHTEPGTQATTPDSEQAPPAEPAPAPSPANDQPSTEAPPPAEATPPAEAQTKQEDPPAAAPEVKPSPPEAAETVTSQPEQVPAEAKDVGEIHMMIHHHYPRNRVYQGQDHWAPEDEYYYPPPYGVVPYEAHYYNAIHSYSRHRPSAHTSEYGYNLRPTPHGSIIRTVVAEPYSDDYHRRSSSEGSNNITSMFSDENPNACTII